MSGGWCRKAQEAAEAALVAAKAALVLLREVRCGRLEWADAAREMLAVPSSRAPSRFGDSLQRGVKAIESGVCQGASCPPERMWRQKRRCSNTMEL